MPTLTLLRHGRTTANAGGLLQGRVDHALDETGRAQAAAAAAVIGAVDRVISSPLLRARQTAEAFGLTPEIDDRWIELDYGEWDGRPIADLPRAPGSDGDAISTSVHPTAKPSGNSAPGSVPPWTICPDPTTITSWWYRTCLPSRQRWRGHWESTTPSAGGPTWRPGRSARSASEARLRY